jgi:predicted cupin superfamily sugar epimerase
VADAIIERHGLEPHPEGGWFAETWRGPSGGDGRAIGTSILFLLRAGERSHWHRIDATEIWHHHAGDPLRLTIVTADGDRTASTVGDASAGHEPMAVVPPHAWQSAEPLGDFSLVGCTVTPGFTFDGFELAPPDWSP